MEEGDDLGRQESVQVAVRIRPLTLSEQLSSSNALGANKQSAACFTPQPFLSVQDNCIDYYDGRQSSAFLQTDSNNINLPTQRFLFDHVLPAEGTTQGTVYNCLVKPMLSKCLHSGFNATVMAYGQTGSGKTYTMGTSFFQNSAQHPIDNNADVDLDGEEEGIVPRAIKDTSRFLAASERAGGNPQCYVTFVELYNEELRDLLAPFGANNLKRSGISLREDQSGVIILTGVHEHQIDIPKDGLDEETISGKILECLKQGTLSRATASTAVNPTSSRSHAILTLTIKTDSTTLLSGSGSISSSRVSKVHFVDLAGSERMKRTGAVGARALEAVSINAGLLALGNVISALTATAQPSQPSNNGTRKHVPYRDSKLTRLLQDSLGGHAKTLLLACISQATQDIPESLCTLRYAARARLIRNHVVTNLIASNNGSSSFEHQQLQRQVAALKSQLQALKAQLAKNHATASNSQRRPPSEDKQHADIIEERSMADHKMKALVSFLTRTRQHLLEYKEGGGLTQPEESAQALLRPIIDDLHASSAAAHQEMAVALQDMKQAKDSLQIHYERQLGLLQENLRKALGERDAAQQQLLQAHRLQEQNQKDKLARRRLRTSSNSSSLLATSSSLASNSSFDRDRHLLLERNAKLSKELADLKRQLRNDKNDTNRTTDADHWRRLVVEAKTEAAHWHQAFIALKNSLNNKHALSNNGNNNAGNRFSSSKTTLSNPTGLLIRNNQNSNNNGIASTTSSRDLLECLVKRNNAMVNRALVGMDVEEDKDANEGSEIPMQELQRDPSK